MKIAMIGHKRIPSREGGVEIVVGELSERMAKAGHSVTAYNRGGEHISGSRFSNGAKLKEYRGVRIVTVPTPKSSSLNAIVYSVFATIRAVFSGCDVIHFHAEGPSAMCFLPHLFKIRTVVTVHGLDWQRAKWGGFATKFLLFGEKTAVKYADEIIVLSKAVKKYFLDTYGRETVFIPNGVTKPEIRKAHIIKEKYSLEKDGYILFLGRLVPEKGIHRLIDAYKEINTDMPLVIAGGSSHTDNYMNSLKASAAGNSKIIFTDFVQGEELEELYSNAYIYVLPSDLEGMPISLLEAMSYGRCCLTSDIPECTEVCGGRALSFRKGDTEDLKNKLQELLESRELVENLRSDCAEYVLSAYNWDNVTAETLALYGDTK